MKKSEVSKIASNLISTIGSLKLYPPTHPAVKSPLGKFFDAISFPIFQNHHLLIRFFEGLIVVDGEPAYELAQNSEEICNFFTKRGIEGFEINRGVKQVDLVNFLKLLIDNDVHNPESVEKLLSQNGIKTIKIITFEKDEVLSKKAKKVYSKAKKMIVDLMNNARRGNFENMGDQANEVIEEFHDIMDKDINAVLPLVILQDYDEYTFNHCVNVGILSTALARNLSLPRHIVIATGVGAMLHDIGKTKIPRSILLKTAKLTDEEWGLLKEHPVFGVEIASKIGKFEEYTLKVIEQHHVGADLTGYPKYKNRSQIVEGSLITATSDNYDAMTTQRPYQRRMEPAQALEIMERKSGQFLDRDIYESFKKMIGRFPPGSIVRLNTNEVGIVSRVNLENPDFPVVKIILDSKGFKVEKPFEVDTNKVDPETGKRNRFILGIADPLTRGLINISHYFSLD